MPLFLTQFGGAFNDNAFKNGLLIWFAYDFADKLNLNMPMVVTLAAGLFIMPFFLFSAIAGQLADKYQRSKLVQIFKITEILIVVLCSIFFYLENLYGLLFLLFLMGAQSAFFGPIKYSLLPEHLKKHELVTGNSLIEGTTFFAILLGTLFGSLVIRSNYGIPILSSVLICCAIFGWTASLFIPSATINDRRLETNYNIVSQTLQILKYARENYIVWLAIIGISWFWMIGATFLTQFPVYTKKIISGDEKLVGLFLTLLAIGVTIGALVCSKILKGKITGKTVIYGSLGITFFIIDFYIASTTYSNEGANNLSRLINVGEFFASSLNSWRIAIDLFLISFSAGIYIVPLYTIMQYFATRKFIARIIAANNIMNSMFMLLSSVYALLLFTLKFVVTELFLSIGIANIIVLFLIKKVTDNHQK